LLAEGFELRDVIGEVRGRHGGIVHDCQRFDVAPQPTHLPILVDDGMSIEQQTYANCASGAQVTSYIVHNGGHTRIAGNRWRATWMQPRRLWISSCHPANEA
jgi:hypothetical protein